MTFERLIEILRGLQHLVSPERVRVAAENLAHLGTVFHHGQFMRPPIDVDAVLEFAGGGEAAAEVSDVGRFLLPEPPPRQPKRRRAPALPPVEPPKPIKR